MASASALTLSNSLTKRLWAWTNERFPPANWPLFFIAYLSALLFGRQLTWPGSLSIGPLDLLGFLGALGFFLMLRVFDEHKDYEADCRLHPGRVLQRGLVRLGHLKAIGAIAIAIQLGLSLLADRGFGPVTRLWVVVMGWSVLMAFEFFARDWLRERLLIYAVSHMLVTPMALVWMAQMGASGELPLAEVAWLAGLSFASGATFEITRKTWGPEEERPGLDSYARVFGVTRSPLVILGLLVAAAGILAVLLTRIFGRLEPLWLTLVGLSLLPPAVTLRRFRANPSARGRKLNEASVGLAMLAGYALLLAAMIAERGLRWN